MASPGYEQDLKDVLAPMASWDESAVPVHWPNSRFEPPAGRRWIRAVVGPLPAYRTDVAARPRSRHPGLLTWEIYEPAGDGAGGAWATADEILARYRRRQQGAVKFWDGDAEPYVIDLGQDGGWYRLQIHVPWVRDTVY